MGLYKKRCDVAKEKDKRKRYWTYVEKGGSRDEIRDDLAETMRSHDERPARIVDHVQAIDYNVAAEILRAQLPQTDKGRSGELGEILAIYKLYNLGRTKLENLIHRIFDPARLDIEIKGRLSNPVIPREWFLVPLFVIHDAVEKIKDGSITGYVYDPNSARLVKRGTPPPLGDSP